MKGLQQGNPGRRTPSSVHELRAPELSFFKWVNCRVCELYLNRAL